MMLNRAVDNMKTGWEAIVVGNWCIQGVSIFPFLCWFCNYLTLFFKTEPSSFLLILLLQNIGLFYSRWQSHKQGKNRRFTRWTALDSMTSHFPTILELITSAGFLSSLSVTYPWLNLQKRGSPTGFSGFGIHLIWRQGFGKGANEIRDSGNFVLRDRNVTCIFGIEIKGYDWKDYDLNR